MAPSLTWLSLLSLLFASLTIVAAQGTDAKFEPAVEKRALGGLASRLFKARDQPLTNAQRLARGLPPQRPKRLYQGPHRSTMERNDMEARAPITGAIHVTSASGADMGYVDKDINFQGFYSLTTDTTSALLVTISPSSSSSDLTTVNGDATYPVVGAVKGVFASDANLQVGSSNYVFVTASSHTDPGSTPQDVPNAYSAATGNAEPSESSIWFVDPTSLVLSNTYVNPSATNNFTLHLMWYAPSSNFALTGDPDAYDAAYPGGVPVTWTIDPTIGLV